MGIERPFQDVKLFSGIIYRSESAFQSVKKQLESFYSPVDMETPALDFDFTPYYNKEMGTPLFRRFISFETLINPELLPDIKLLTNQLEIETAINGKRTINLDPGFLSDANVIIATTKNYYHRVPLTKGIYAHMEYVIIGKNLKILEWTYPDFQSELYMNYFRELLVLYKKNIKDRKIKEANGKRKRNTKEEIQ